MLCGNCEEDAAEAEYRATFGGYKLRMQLCMCCYLYITMSQVAQDIVILEYDRQVNEYRFREMSNMAVDAVILWRGSVRVVVQNDGTKVIYFQKEGDAQEQQYIPNGFFEKKAVDGLVKKLQSPVV